MIDFGFDKIALIGAVALIVIGPEKLPRVARTVGHFIGKAQRYVADVKAEVNRSIELDELKKMKTEFEDAARNAHTSVADHFNQAATHLEQSVVGAADDMAPSHETPAWEPPPPVYKPPKKNWRVKRGAVPQWYKRRNGVRTKAQSAAARVARFRPPGARAPMSPRDEKPDELEGTEQPFVSHLVELRDRLIKALVAVGVCFAALTIWPGPAGLYDLLALPLVQHLPKGGTLIATSVISPFLVPLKITLMAAFLVALPVVLYQVWAFVAPGLYSHEKKLVMPLVVSSTLLFFLGIAFCYFFVFGKVFTFIQSFAPKSVSAMPDIEAYLSFVLTMFIAFGSAFEVPIVVVVLARMGLVTVQQLKGFRSYFIVLAFIIAAVLTPPDVVSQLALAVPMVLLYEAGIWAAQVFIRHTQPVDDAGAGTTTTPS